MSMEFPKVSIRAIDITDADLASLEKTRKFLNPGIHDVKVAAIDVKGPAEKDPTFIKVVLKLESAEGSAINAMIMVPTAHLKYKGAANAKGEMYPYRNLVELFTAIGEDDITPKTVPGLITQYFQNDEITGHKLQIKVAFRGLHIKYVSKGLYALADANSDVMKDEDGNPLASGDTRDAAKALAVSAGFANLKDWPDVTAFIRSEHVGSRTVDAAASDW
jgi:hypothetical protein